MNMCGFGLTGVCILIVVTLNLLRRRMPRSAVGSWVKSAVKLSGKTVLITGANTGLGYQTALDLAKRDASIILACRNIEKAEAAKKQIEDETGSQKLVIKSLDLSSFASIRQFAKDIKETESKLDILINNAGIMKVPEGKTKDGFEMQFGVNHLGTFLLTNSLLDLIKESGSARIITLTSMAHIASVINWNDLNWTKRRYKAMEAYNDSKLMNILFTQELSKRLSDTGVTANCVHPGIVRTELNRTAGQDSTLYGRLMDWMFRQSWITKNAEHGAQTTIYCAIAPELENVTGKYFSNCTQGWTNRLLISDAKARRLWEISEELTELQS